MFEHEVEQLYETQKTQILSCLRKPELHFRHQKGHQRAGAILGSIIMMKNTTILVNGVDNQKTNNIEEVWKLE